ncbi:MAG: hypothetical protein ABJA69_10255 [Acidobacteriaceae bacterium]
MKGTPETPELPETATPGLSLPLTTISDQRDAALEDRSRKNAASSHRHLQLWFRRLGMLIFVSICAVVGVVLVILPWRPEWTDNHLLLSNPGLRALVTNSFIRGLCSGLGALDIWIGFSQAITYHEESRA